MACIDPAILCWMEAHPGTASWFQAVGSVAAIAAGVLLASVTIREQRLQTWRRGRQFLNEPVIVLNWLISNASGRLDAVKRGPGICQAVPRTSSAKRADGWHDGKARLTGRSECPDTKVAGSVALLPTWYRENELRFEDFLAGRGVVASQVVQGVTTLGILDLADVHHEALNNVRANALAALKTIR